MCTAHLQSAISSECLANTEHEDERKWRSLLITLKYTLTSELSTLPRGYSKIAFTPYIVHSNSKWHYLGHGLQGCVTSLSVAAEARRSAVVYTELSALLPLPSSPAYSE